ncbi:MAG TPA: sigma-70 family RNA polymerase sigma factor [Bryobacteraceae bacterium]|nr:sigma-70 family RNA polymerase sigma factor [Bryobacteraceae bacterium]
MGCGSTDVTDLLLRWNRGEARALDKLMPYVYQELRSLAAAYMYREESGHTLRATDLVHEVYLKLVDQRQVNWQNRAHFFGVSAKLMRRILVDHAKAAKAARRGGNAVRTLIDESSVWVRPDEEILVLNSLLSRLEELDPRKAQVTQLRFFGGLTNQEAAEFLGISVASVERDWKMAKAWLYRELKSAETLPE